MAGLTRGAIYWHFKDKIELFLAVRMNVLLPMLEEIDSIISSDSYADPLDGVEAALRRIFQILDDCPAVKIVLETMINRCEHVADFANIQSELDRPATELLSRLDYAYRKAAALGTLCPGLNPELIARDTWAFTYGLVLHILTSDTDCGFRNHVSKMISLHMALRRFNAMPHSE